MNTIMTQITSLERILSDTIKIIFVKYLKNKSLNSHYSFVHFCRL